MAKKKGKPTTFSSQPLLVVDGSGIRDEKKSGSRINIPDTQHCYPPYSEVRCCSKKNITHFTVLQYFQCKKIEINALTN
jgi:hypothetical protein